MEIRCKWEKCGKYFAPTRKNQQYCCEMHRQAARAERIREKKAKRRCECPGCDNLFTSSNPNQRFCSDACREKYKMLQREQAAEERRQAKERERQEEREWQEDIKRWRASREPKPKPRIPLRDYANLASAAGTSYGKLEAENESKRKHNPKND